MILVAAAGGYAWWQFAVTARVESGARLDRINARIDDITQRLDSLAPAQEDLGNRLRQLEGRLDSRIEWMRGEIRAQRDAATARGEEILGDVRALSDSIDQLRTKIGRGVDEWSLHEVEQLMVFARQRLQLSADAELAGKALRLADDRLRQLADPALVPVREILAGEIAALDGATTVDVAGTLNALSALAREVDDLPLAGDGDTTSDVTGSGPASRSAGETGDDASSWGIFKNLLADLGALVQIETGGKSLPPILSAELRLIIFEKTKLIIESCQLAFLRGQGGAYRARMAAAKNWVAANFDTESDRVDAWLARQSVLAAAAPATELPDISASLRALREVMRVGN